VEQSSPEGLHDQVLPHTSMLNGDPELAVMTEPITGFGFLFDCPLEQPEIHSRIGIATAVDRIRFICVPSDKVSLGPCALPAHRAARDS
jgi:hypothetical protein